jgi:hypothetical protein
MSPPNAGHRDQEVQVLECLLASLLNEWPSPSALTTIAIWLNEFHAQFACLGDRLMPVFKPYEEGRKCTRSISVGQCVP